MTSRERVLKALNHEIPDRVPITDEVWDRTMRRWQGEGLPAGATVGRERDSGCFNFDFWQMEMVYHPLPVRHSSPIECGEYVLDPTPHGGRVKRRKDGLGFAMLVDWPIKRKEDWPDVKSRLKPAPERIDWAGAERGYQDACKRELFRTVVFSWGLDMIQWYVNHEELLMLMVEDPAWVREMIMTQMEMELGMCEMFAERGFSFDAAWVLNDLGYRNGLLISPDTYRKTHYDADKTAFDYFHSKGMKVILHTDGDMRELIPVLIDVGVDCLEPLEVKANMDLIDLKKRYGDRLALMGGIDVRLMEDPDPSKIEEEIRTKVQVAKQGGGYIFHSDHSITDQISLQRFEYILELARKYGSY